MACQGRVSYSIIKEVRTKGENQVSGLPHSYEPLTKEIDIGRLSIGKPSEEWRFLTEGPFWLKLWGMSWEKMAQ
ncbi:Uncharacterized protein HZ326_21022 [Fusarium oxysporum f. sp. albedinis]|nr:Uncharacterized protein HZ326_21022 [Fusarium oxysporum f. sp. albedinis]